MRSREDEAVATGPRGRGAGRLGVPWLAALQPAADVGQRAQAGLWLQRTIGNEATRRLARRIARRRPAAPPTLAGLQAPAHKTFKSREEMLAALTGGGIWTGPIALTSGPRCAGWTANQWMRSSARRRR